MPTGNLIIRCGIRNMTLIKSDQKHAEKLMKLLTNEMGTDVIISGRDGQQLKVHKVFLCMYSKVFSEMLAERSSIKDQLIEIRLDEDPKAINMMIEFIYSGQRPIFEHVNVALNVLDLAAKYGIEPQKNDALYYLNLSIDIDNVLKILITAKKYNCPEIKRHALNIIDQNFKLVVKTESFDNFPNEFHYLLKDILKKIAQ